MNIDRNEDRTGELMADELGIDFEENEMMKVEFEDRSDDEAHLADKFRTGAEV